MQRASALLVVLLTCASLLGCPSSKVVSAPTQVMLRIYNNDPALSEQMTTLEVAFSLLEGDTYREYPVKRFDQAKLAWPVDVPIIPGKHGDEFKQFEVVVRALADERVLAEARAVTSFVPEERRVLEVWLYMCPGHDEPSFACATPDCHGESCEVCLADGNCRAVGLTTPTDLPVLADDSAPQTKPMPTEIITETVEVPDSGLPPTSAMDAGQGDGSVVSSNECSMACQAHASCVLKAGAPSCECSAGFSAGAGGACVDVDECMRPDRGGCSVNADCKNVEGSRTCSCKEGYQDTKGDGSECTSRCSLAGCDANASCSLVGAEAKCQCTGAYSGDGKTCTYNPSCAALNCGANTSCGLKAGSSTDYECKCQSGYQPDTSMPAFACKDIDECSSTPSVCAATAQSSCSNTPGGFTCPCKSGFRKNAAGTSCEDIPDCNTGACAGGACVEGVNDYSCNCAAGYTPAANGKSCMDARNDCPAGACTPGGTCVDGVNAYSCTCATAGYTLSADKHSCVDNNDCVPNPCKNGGVCSDRVNDFLCDCTGTGFIGKDCGTRSTGCAMVGTSCSVGRGECLRTGTYVCDAQGANLVCNVSAGSAVAELCDNKDNDCDGSVDEDFPTLRMSCTAGMGACAATGINVCNGTGSGVSCNAITGTPAANDAVCNNRDDDCNGQIDEDYVKQASSCGRGVCANTGMTSCVMGVVQQNCSEKPSSAETCDGLDNNCDGTVDNAASLPDTCLDNDRLQRCVSGATRTDRCSQRTPTAGTCVVNACMGSCYAGSTQCDTSGNLQTCDSGGKWGQGIACMTNFLCTKPNGPCAANNPRTLGRDTTNGFQHIFGHAYLALTPVLANEDLRVLMFGALSHANATGGTIDMALYGDQVVAGRHRPGRLMAGTTLAKTLAVPNRVTYLTPADTGLNLVANTLYWVAIKTNVSGSENLAVYEYQDRAAQSDGTGTIYETTLTSWVDPFPTNFPTNVTPQDGLELSLFLQVQRYWH